VKAALDAGHGALSKRPHTGACANRLVEDDVALDMVGRIGHHLRSMGCETVYTRPEAKSVGITERARTARYSRAKVFLSVHCNAGPSSASGVEAFGVNGDQRSLRLAEGLIESIIKLGLRSRGVKWDSQSQHSRLGVLRGTYRAMPAVLLELGVLTSEHASALLKNRHFRDTAAKAVAEVLRRWLRI